MARRPRPGEVGTTAAERACLARHAKGKTRAAELGVWHGGTIVMLRAAIADDGILYAVDPFTSGRLGVSFPRLIARGEVARVQNGRVEWGRDSAQPAALTQRVRSAALFDFVFVDSHRSKRSFEAPGDAWSPLIAPNGLIAVHDSRLSAEPPGFIPDSLPYASSVVRNEPRFDLIDEAGLITVLRKITP